MREKPVTKLDIARKAFALMLLGIEPMLNEELDEYVKRGEAMIRLKMTEEESDVEKQEA